MTIFYFMMGIYVHLNVDFFRTNFAYSILVTVLNVFVTPLIVWLMGYLSGLKCRTTIYTRYLSPAAVYLPRCPSLKPVRAHQSSGASFEAEHPWPS